jgi:hypothetical protein
MQTLTQVVVDFGFIRASVRTIQNANGKRNPLQQSKPCRNGASHAHLLKETHCIKVRSMIILVGQWKEDVMA